MEQSGAAQMNIKPLPARVEQHARDWNVIIENTLDTETSVIAFGKCGSQPVVLKVARKDGGEEWRSGEILHAFGGHGMVRPLAYTAGAVLLRRLTPGHDLTTLSLNGRDDEAIEIIARIIEQMSAVNPRVNAFAAVADLKVDFDRFRHCGGDLIPMNLIERAERWYSELCDSQTNLRLIHGDLHHYNVLFDAELGWLAIDPWGAFGEIECEVGASLRNPLAFHLLSSPRAMERRMALFEARLKFNTERALKWAFSQTVLAALWPEGDGVDMRAPFVTAAKSMLPLFGE